MNGVTLTLVVWCVVFVTSMYAVGMLIHGMRGNRQADTLEYFRGRMEINRGRDEVEPRVLIAEHQWQSDLKLDRNEAAWLLLALYLGLNPKTMRLSDDFATYFVYPVTSFMRAYFHFADLEEMAYRQKFNDALLIALPKCKTLEEALLILVRKK